VLVPEGGLLFAIEVRQAVPTGECRSGEDAAGLRQDIRVCGERGDRASGKLCRFGLGREFRRQVHSFEPHEAGRDGDAGDAVGSPVVGHLLGQLVGGVLHDLVEGVTVRAVENPSDVDDQPVPAAIIIGAARVEAKAAARRPPANIRSQWRHSISQNAREGSGEIS
jgi:hypothetical protein